MILKKTIASVLCACLFLLVQCGKKGPLRLEPVKNPPPISEISISQHGYNLELKWQYPPFLLDQKTQFSASQIRRVQIYYSDKEIPEEKFRKKSEMIRRIEGADLSKRGGTTSLKLEFAPQNLQKATHYFSLNYTYHRKRAPMSTVKQFKSQIPPEAGKQLSLSKENKVIVLKWKKPDKDMLGKRLSNLSGYRVYKKVDPAGSAQSQAVFKPMTADPILQEYLEDHATTVDGTYSYYYTSLLSADIESDGSNHVTVEVVDTFPPEIPANLFSMIGPDHIYLTWEEVADADFAHFRVYRKAETDNEYKLIADTLSSTIYRDRTVKKGSTYQYYVTSVDKKGNESENSNVVSEDFRTNRFF